MRTKLCNKSLQTSVLPLKMTKEDGGTTISTAGSTVGTSYVKIQLITCTGDTTTGVTKDVDVKEQTTHCLRG